jgi:predicted PurR-regulated permease PerM
MHDHSVPSGTNILIILASLIIVIAGMREAQSILVPFLLSGFIAIIAAPAMFVLTTRRIPAGIALLLVLSMIVLVGMLIGVMVGNSADNFSAQLPSYQERLNVQKAHLIEQLQDWGITVPDYALSKILDPARAMTMAAQGLTSLGGLLTNTFLILLTVAFMLMEAASFPAKLKAIFKDPEKSLGHVQQVMVDIKRYMAIKTATSLLTGVAIATWLWLIGLDYPLLWGTLAFFLNFVPNIGSIIAAVPTLLLAFVQLGPAGALWTAVGYGVVNTLVGNIIEPRFMGRGLGLSSLVVFLSLVFWGWVLGTVGMFLSVPLTMTVKIILDSKEETRWIAVLLGPEIREEEERPARHSGLEEVFSRLRKGPMLPGKGKD